MVSPVDVSQENGKQHTDVMFSSKNYLLPTYLKPSI